MKKSFIALGIFVGIVIILAAIVYSSYYSSGPMASLVIDSGTVQYKTASGEWKDANNGMTLKQGYSVKTLADSFAKIIFSDSVTRLDANSEIALEGLSQDSISISQTAGKTWSRILKISGLSTYEISTPDAIATVRGTAFAIEVGNETVIKVLNGTVLARIDGTLIEKLINANREAGLDKEDTSIDDTDLMLDEWMNQNIQQDAKYIQELKQKLLDKYGFLINIVKSQNPELTDAQIDQLIDEWLDGQHSVKKAIEDGTIPGSIAGIIPYSLRRY